MQGLMLVHRDKFKLENRNKYSTSEKQKKNIPIKYNLVLKEK